MTFMPETTTEAKRKLVTPLWNAKKVNRVFEDTSMTIVNAGAAYPSTERRGQKTMLSDTS